MNAARLGQCTVIAIVLFLALRFAHKRGFLRGWRARDAQRSAARIVPPPRWRPGRTEPVLYPAIDPDASDAVDHG